VDQEAFLTQFIPLFIRLFNLINAHQRCYNVLHFKSHDEYNVLENGGNHFETFSLNFARNRLLLIKSSIEEKLTVEIELQWFNRVEH